MDSYPNKFKRLIIPLTVTVICLYGLYLRMLILNDHEFWADEYAYLRQMTGSFGDLLKNIPNEEFCSYLSGDIYLVYPFFKIAPYNKWVLAIPHIIATVAGFYVLYLLAKRYLTTLSAYLITFTVVCLNGTLMHHATEIRPYAVLPTLALACLYFSLELVEKGQTMSGKRRWCIGAFFVMVLWFHLYGLLTLVFPIAFALFTKIGDKSFKSILLYTVKFLLIVFFVAAPLWLVSVFGPHLPRGGDSYGFSTYMFIPNPFTDSVGFLKAIFGNLVGRKNLYFLLVFMLTPFLLSYKERFQQIAFLLILVLVPVGVLFVLDVAHNYFFVQRQFIWTMPFFALFLGWSFDSFNSYLQQRPFCRKIFKGGI